jgi:hypothetical protein
MKQPGAAASTSIIAAYLGGELAKAEAALRLGLRYEQDQPLRREAKRI